VRDVRLLLEGRNRELADMLEERMLQTSEEMRYELAAKYRDLRKTVIKLSEQQKMAMSPERDIDTFGYYREGPQLALQLFTMREGNIVGRRSFSGKTYLQMILTRHIFLAKCWRNITRRIMCRGKSTFRWTSTIASCWKRRSVNEKDGA